MTTPRRKKGSTSSDTAGNVEGIKSFSTSFNMSGTETFAESPVISQTLVDELQKINIPLPAPILGNELGEQDNLRKRKVESSKFYGLLKKLKDEQDGSTFVTDEDIANACLYDSAMSVALLLPKITGYVTEAQRLHKKGLNARVHRPEDTITPILNAQSDDIPEKFPKTLHELEEMHEDAVSALETYYGLHHDRKEHMSDRRRQIRHFLGIYNID